MLYSLDEPMFNLGFNVNLDLTHYISSKDLLVSIMLKVAIFSGFFVLSVHVRVPS